MKFYKTTSSKLLKYQESAWQKMRMKRSHNAKPYLKYIHSVWWKLKREEAFKFYGRVCSVCKSQPKSLDVHHLTYKRFKKEKMEDLQILCRDCHDKVHLPLFPIRTLGNASSAL